MLPKDPDPTLGEKDLPAELRVKLNHALDKVLAILAEKEFEIIGDSGAQKGFFFKKHASSKKQFQKPRRCVFPGCTNASIPSSHTLQRNGPLAAIAEHNHVLSPEVSLTLRKLELGSIGIGEASTFPGFCSKHEGAFAELEQRRDLTTDRDVALQTFRTICREVVMKRHQIQDFEQTLASWKKTISDRGIELINKELGDLLHKYPDFKMQSVVAQGVSKYERILSKTLSELNELATLLEQEFLNAAFADIEGRKPGMSHFVLRVQQAIPVCLAGLGTFHVGGSTEVTKVAAILNVWPTENNSVVSISVLEKHDDALKAYLAMQLKRLLGPLEMVETWMVNGSDHWFIKPSVWYEIPVERRSKILEDILDDTYSIGQPYHRSIFDSLRREMLSLPREEGESQAERAREMEKLG